MFSLKFNSWLIDGLKKAGYNIEVCIGAEETMVVVEFPVKIDENIRTNSEVSMWEKLQLVAFMQEYWSDNQVSATITFDPDTEAHQIKPALEYFQYKLKSISFLPTFKGSTAYPQMPYESIDEKTYNEMISKIGELNFNENEINEEEVEFEYDTGCSGGACVLKPFTQKAASMSNNNNNNNNEN